MLYPSVLFQKILKPILPFLEKYSPTKYHSTDAHKTSLQSIETDDASMLFRFFDGFFLYGFFLTWSNDDLFNWVDPKVRDNSKRDFNWFESIWKRTLKFHDNDIMIAKLFSVSANCPSFQKRFKDAKIISGSQKGSQLPFGSPRKNAPSFQPRRSAMAGVMCVGDSASLVDPFTGEGIGNGMVSAKLTSKYFDKEKHKHGFPNDIGEMYMKELWEILGKELTNSYRLQRWARNKRLMNWFSGRASKKKELSDMLTGMIADKEASTKLWSPWFLIKALLLP